MKDGMLEIKDAPMFGRVMRNANLCKQVLEVILGIEIDHVEYLNTEQEISAYTEARGVRLDVYLKASDKVYDIEMQTTDTPYGKRMRYYQAMIDSALLDKGTDYPDLAESYIIFICTQDPFRCDIPIYTFERRCLENEVINIEDESHWLVINSAAWDKDTNKARSELLQYIENGRTGNDPLTQALSREVKRNNDNNEWRRNAVGFMTYEIHQRGQLSYAEQKGFARGVEEGEARTKALIDKLLADDRIDDLRRSTTDEAFCNKLYEEYGL